VGEDAIQTDSYPLASLLGSTQKADRQFSSHEPVEFQPLNP
jgi:hypothetical protein